jgi:ATP-dependent exoDNAse (exonuclease V) beta subunit
MQPGDLVMSRCNAPLISCAYQLLRANKRVHIQGRDFGKGLETLIRKITELAKQDLRSCTVNDFTTGLATYEARETQRILLDNKQVEKKLANLEDKLLCLRYLCEGLADTGEVIDRLNMIFSDDPDTDHKYIILSSVHRAKGLEAERTFILEPEKFPHPMAKQVWEKTQELNCLFVAITRSKHSMTFVGGLPRPLSHHASSVTKRQPDQAAAVHEETTGSGEVPVLQQPAVSGSCNDVRSPQEVPQQAPSTTTTSGTKVSGRTQQTTSSPTPADSGRRTPRSGTANWKRKGSSDKKG